MTALSIGTTASIGIGLPPVPPGDLSPSAAATATANEMLNGRTSKRKGSRPTKLSASSGPNAHAAQPHTNAHPLGSSNSSASSAQKQQHHEAFSSTSTANDDDDDDDGIAPGEDDDSLTPPLRSPLLPSQPVIAHQHHQQQLQPSHVLLPEQEQPIALTISTSAAQKKGRGAQVTQQQQMPAGITSPVQSSNGTGQTTQTHRFTLSIVPNSSAASRTEPPAVQATSGSARSNKRRAIASKSQQLQLPTQAPTNHVVVANGGGGEQQQQAATANAAAMNSIGGTVQSITPMTQPSVQLSIQHGKLFLNGVALPLLAPAAAPAPAVLSSPNAGAAVALTNALNNAATNSVSAPILLQSLLNRTVSAGGSNLMLVPNLSNLTQLMALVPAAAAAGAQANLSTALLPLGAASSSVAPCILTTAGPVSSLAADASAVSNSNVSPTAASADSGIVPPATGSDIAAGSGSASASDTSDNTGAAPRLKQQDPRKRNRLEAFCGICNKFFCNKVCSRTFYYTKNNI